jgi:hypothetical protein
VGFEAGGSRRVGGSAAMTTIVWRERAGLRVGGAEGAVLAAALPPGTKVAPEAGVRDGVTGPEAGGTDATPGCEDDEAVGWEPPGTSLETGTVDEAAGVAGGPSSPKQPDTASRQASPRMTT